MDKDRTINAIKELIVKYERMVYDLRKKPNKTKSEHNEALKLEDEIIPFYYKKLRELGGSFND